MSVSSLPEWKQLLLEKKRREEEERERREKEEEEKLASMPAWKRGIIQRRKAKQEGMGDREKDRDVCLLQVDARSPSDCLSDTDSSVTVNLGSEPSLSPDPGQWVDAEPKLVSQVSVETIVPVHENPFIRTQSAWRKGRDAEVGNEPEVKEREKDKSISRGQDGESGRGRDIELKIEKFRDLSQGRERENSRESTEKDKSQWKELAKDAAREQDFVKVRKDAEEKETQPAPGSFSPAGPCLRTIRADNIIIIEQDRKGSDERRARWSQAERERPEEDSQAKRGMKMDLREILAGGGSVTEIRASEVLIIKPSTDPEERSAAGKGREDGEGKSSMDVKRELRTDMSWLREKETAKEKERPWGQATVINKDERKDSLDDNVFVDRGGRVSKLLSKFGEHCKAPSRSKSSDNFLQPGRRKYSGDEDEQQSEERKADGKYMLLKGAPKRSFSFSDRVICAKENGLEDHGYYERKMRERIHSDKNLAPWEDMASLGRDTPVKIKLGCARLLDKDRFARHRDAHIKSEDDKGGFVQRRNEAEIQHRSEVKKVEPVDKRAAEKVGDADGDKGFTVASVKNTEGISFARRVPIRQDGRARADKEVKTLTGERSLEREQSVEKDSELGGQTEAQVCDNREEEFESTVPPEASYVVAASAELASSSHVDESFYRHDSAFTECSSLLCTVTDRAAHRAPEWGGTGPRDPYMALSGLSQNTEDLISKIQKVGDTTVYSNERGERVYEVAQELTKDSKPEVQTHSDGGHDITPRSPRRIPPIGIPSGPLEIQIPRSVFYVAEEVEERKTTEGQDWEGGQGVERRDSWRIGKPLSRVESLREKIRQRELERLRQREAQDGDGSEAAEIGDTQAARDRYEERGNEIEEEWEAAAHMRKRLAETERRQEDAAAQTSVAAFDVTQEVDVLKTCPQLPVSDPQSPVESRGEEVISGYATAASEVISDSFQISEDEDDPLKDEEQLRCHKSRHESSEEEQEEEEEEEKELSAEEVEESALPLESGQSLSSSPPHPNSLAAMSRIYNLEAVGSRTGLCLRDRTVDISSSVHLVKVKPLISNSQQGDSKAFAGDDVRGVQTIQQQIQQFQLKEQEALKSSTSSDASQKDSETKEKQSPRRVFKHQVKQDVKTQEKEQGTPEQSPKASPHRVCSPASKKQTITVAPSILRNQSPDSSLKPTNCAPTPASSPCSPSPAPSPSISPSSTPSPTLFSIRSASGGQVKRGATITITPRRPAATGVTVGSTAVSTTVSTAVSTAVSTVRTTAAAPTQATPAVAEPVKKKYPTVEEIEVIGGYQNLEKSCLVKNRGTPKKTKVCFDEEQLEQVCEYPSENSMLAFNPYTHDLGRMEKLQGEEAAEEGEVAKRSVLHKGVIATETAKGPRVKVGESCPR